MPPKKSTGQDPQQGKVPNSSGKKKEDTKSSSASQASTVSAKHSSSSRASAVSAKHSSNSSIKYKYTKLQLKLNPYIYNHIYKNVDIISKFVKFNRKQIIETIKYLQQYGFYYIDIERRKKEIKGGVAKAGRDADLGTIAPDELSAYKDFVKISLDNIDTIFNKLNANVDRHTVYVDHNDESPQSSIKVVMNFNSKTHLFMIGFVDTNPPQDVQQKLDEDGQPSDIAVLPIHYSFFINESGPESRRGGNIHPPHSSHFSIHSNSYILTQENNKDITKHSDSTMGYVSTNWGIFNITYTGNENSVKINTPVVSFQELHEILNHSDFIKKISFTEASDDPEFYDNAIDDNTSGTEIQQYLKKMCSKTVPAVMRKVLKNFLLPIIREYCTEKYSRISTGTNGSSTRYYISPFLDAEGAHRKLAAHAAFHVASGYNGIERTFNRLDYQDSQITINKSFLQSVFTINQRQFRDDALVPLPQNQMPASIAQYLFTELGVRNPTEIFMSLLDRQNQQWLELLNKQKLVRDTPDDLSYQQQEKIMYNQFDERYDLFVAQFNNLLHIKNYNYFVSDQQLCNGTTAQYEELHRIQYTVFNHMLQILALHHRNQTIFYDSRGLNNTKRNNLIEYQDRQKQSLTAVLSKYLDIIKSLIDAGDSTPPAEKYTIYSRQKTEVQRLEIAWLNAKHRFSGFQTFEHPVETAVDLLYPGQIVNDKDPMAIGGETKSSSERNKYPLIVGDNGIPASPVGKKLKQMKVLTFVYSTVSDILQTSNYFKIIPIITKLSNIKSFRFNKQTDAKKTNETTLFNIDTIITDRLERDDFIKKFDIKYVALNVINKEYFIKHTRKAQVLKLNHKQLLENLTYRTINSDRREIGKFISSYEYENPGSSLLEIIGPNTTVPYFQVDNKKVIEKPIKAQSAPGVIEKLTKAQTAPGERFLDEKFLLLSSLYTMLEQPDTIKKAQSVPGVRKPTNLIEDIIYIGN